MNLLRGYGLTRCGSFPSWFRLCSFTEPISENKIKLKVHFFRQDLLSCKYGMVWLFLPPGNVVAERSYFQSCLLVILSTVGGGPIIWPLAMMVLWTSPHGDPLLDMGSHCTGTNSPPPQPRLDMDLTVQGPSSPCTCLNLFIMKHEWLTTGRFLSCGNDFMCESEILGPGTVHGNYVHYATAVVKPSGIIT